MQISADNFIDFMTTVSQQLFSREPIGHNITPRSNEWTSFESQILYMGIVHHKIKLDLKFNPIYG